MPILSPIAYLALLFCLCVVVAVALFLAGFFDQPYEYGHCPHCYHRLDEDEYTDCFCSSCSRVFTQDQVEWD